MNKKANMRKLRIKSGIFFLIILFIIAGIFVFFNQFHINQEKLNATYAAESTIRNIETQLSRYIENSNLFKNIIVSEGSVDEQQFNRLAGFMKKNKDVIEAYELAPDGIVKQIYPYEGNEEAYEMNMLELSERKREALLAKESEKYTIAGPYELKQGGIGALIFDPIYVEDNTEFWGFSILVLNWESFMKEFQVTKLSDAGYRFNIWKRDSEGNRVTIADDGYGEVENALVVQCSVPNDTWYFEIAPKKNWIPLGLKVIEIIISVIIAFIISGSYIQVEKRKYREIMYADKLEKTAKEARKASEAKTRFLFNMSHDIRTPMNAIMGYSELLEDSLDDKEIALNYISKIKASNSMLLSLINYVLEMARIESGKVVLKEENGNLKKFVEMLKIVSQPQIEQKHLDIVWNLNVIHEDVRCDTTKMREIILNIVSNSIKYTPEGGKISVTITELKSDNVKYADYSFIIKDNGIGVDKDYLPHIFEEFSREHTSTESSVVGAGLGLPIVKSLVEMMNGRIEVQSERGKGTTFSVYLTFPIIDKKQELLEEKKNNSNEVVLTGLRLLLVEDNELNAEIAKEIMTRRGIQVELASNGEECLKILEKKPDYYYDAILMDVQMPVMNGYETTREIRSKTWSYASVPIIAVTANAFEEDKQKALQSGMNDFIAKPIEIPKLIEVLSKLIES